MNAMASQITSLTIVYSTVYSGADQRKHEGSASLAFVRGIHRSPVNSPHKWPVARKMLLFDDVILETETTIHIVVSARTNTDKKSGSLISRVVADHLLNNGRLDDKVVYMKDWYVNRCFRQAR